VSTGEFTITKTLVLKSRHGPDTVVLTTDLPCPWPSAVTTAPLDLEFKITPGYAEQYLERVFGIPSEEVEIIKTYSEGDDN
jgi:hypothetical protein